MTTPNFRMNLTAFKKTFFSSIKDPVERMIRKNTEVLIGQTRLTAQRSMKYVAKLSKPKLAKLMKGSDGQVYSQVGQPPLAKVGLVKERLYYAWMPRTKSAIAGPAKLNIRGWVPKALEFGGGTLIETGKRPNRHVIEVAMKGPRPYMNPALAKIMTPANVKRVYTKSLRARK